ncbi:natural cytotoxicity triggering receptor 3 ligand 1-like isoform X2 [Hemitrygon akajei]|uniref:natural cytotoxicity triggering receptor 3 ligand 1-like isoform X2 n=1 Tax=Hemitrygon akajei TaxID=2704970 RepID=UPI003BF94DBA
MAGRSPRVVPGAWVMEFGRRSKNGVQWLYGSQKKEIYTFNAGAVTARRSAVKISATELQKGDASLHLQNIQLSEAGEYTCVVLVTPDKVEKSSRVVVLGSAYKKVFQEFQSFKSQV